MKDLAAIVETIRGLKEPAALATLVRVTGSSYRKPGARMVFGAEGIRKGLISAGCLEEDVIERLDSVLAGDRPQLVVYDMGSELDAVWGTGMGCQGKVEVLLERVLPGQVPGWMTRCLNLLETRQSGVLATVFVGSRNTEAGSTFVVGFESDPAWQQAATAALEHGSARSVTLPTAEGSAEVLLQPVLPPVALWIYGAGEPSRPIVRMAKELGWFVGVVDHRSALATVSRFPGADRLVVGPPPVSLPGLPFDHRSAALIISHVFERDQEALEVLHRAPLAYLGLQGNRKRCAQLLETLPSEARTRVRAPAGLDLGAETPEAIGLAMLAEIQMTLSGRSGVPLKDSHGPIHS